MTLANPFSTKTARVSKILASEVNAAGEAISHALDGTGGGPYNPSAPLVIGGSGLQIENTATLTVLSGGTLSVPSGGTVSAASGSTVTLAGTNTLSGTNAVSGATTITGATTATDLTMTGTNKVKLASRSIPRVQTSFFSTDDATVWTIEDTGGARQIDATPGARVASCPLRVPHPAIITSVSVRVAPSGGHGGLPGTMPHLYVRKLDLTTGSYTAIADAADGSASVPAYELPHEITVSGMSETVDRTTQRYFINLTGEDGANAQTNMRAFRVSCTYTTAAYDED